MSNTLSNISRPIKDELVQFNEIFRNSLKSKVPLVDLITRYIMKQKGKRIRPLLVMLSGKINGEVGERTHRGAVLVEMLHTATLVHDDVVDNSDKRRGFPSINAIWKNKIAVLMGDYLLSRGLMIAVEGGDFDFLRIITQTVKRMSEGELLQIQKTRKLDIDETTYFKIISDKTASLIGTCCELGCASTTDNAKQILAMRSYGENLGLAFQIRDDILDFEGVTKLFGKPIGADIKDKKMTLPLIHALNRVEKSETGRIKKLIKGEKKENIEKVIDFVKANGGLEYAKEKARQIGDKAKAELAIFSDSSAKESLINLVDFVLERNL